MADDTNNDRQLTLREIVYIEVMLAIDRNSGDKKAAADELGVSLKTIYNILARNDPRSVTDG